MSEELLKSINAKMSQMVLEVHTLCTFLANQPDAGRGDFDAEFEAAKTTALPGVAPISSVPAGNILPDVERDNDGKGVPWDERIHAKTKTKTVKGMWKRGKGVDADLYTSVMAELEAKWCSGDNSTAPPGIAPVAATPPGIAPVVTPPGIAPTAPVVDSPDKKRAMENIAVLTDEYGVDYSLVLFAIKEAFAAENFDSITVEQYPFAGALFDRWVNGVRECDEEVELIAGFGGKPAIDGVTQLYANNSIAKLSDMKHCDVAGIKAALTDYRVQWENFANAQ